VASSILAVSSVAVLDVCEQHGVDTKAILADVGLDRDDLANPDARIPSEVIGVLWRAAYSHSGNPALALHAAGIVPFGAYRVVDYLAAAAPTVGSAFHQVAACFPLINPTVALVIEYCEEGIWVRLVLRDPLPRAYVEYALAAVYRRVLLATRVRFAPVAVEFAYPAVRNDTDHVRTFECPVRFGSAASQFLLRRATWDTPTPAGDVELMTVLGAHVQRLLERPDNAQLPGLDDVRAAIHEQLRLDDTSLAAVARRLATSTRGLQRRLMRSGARYTELLEQMRATAARTYLLQPGRSIGEVASLLGFTQPSSFTRAFRRWTGCAPNDYQHDHARPALEDRAVPGTGRSVSAADASRCRGDDPGQPR
jgi:AraC-like DNA-binding protein